MARKIKTPLAMKDGVSVSNIEDFKQHYDSAKAIEHFNSGKLLKWLSDRYYEEEAGKVEELSGDDPELATKLGAIFGIEVASAPKVEYDPEREKRLKKLKQYTADRRVFEKVDQVAFDQEELGDLLDDDCDEIYLCSSSSFRIPLRVRNKTYIGVDEGGVVVTIVSNKLIDFDSLGIKFKNIKFDDKYAAMVREDETARAKEDSDHEMWFERGEKAMDSGDRETAMELYKKAAELGNDKACMALGVIYAGFVNESDTDIEQAKYWLKEGAERGNELALNCYCDIAATDDEYELFKWLKKQADNGNEIVWTTLGFLSFAP